MGFVQIIEFRTSRIDEMREIGKEWEEAIGDESLARRRVMCEDRDNPGRYFNIVFFDSHEEAMRNSENPVTQQFAERMAAATDGGPTFYNLDVLEER